MECCEEIYNCSRQRVRVSEHSSYPSENWIEIAWTMSCKCMQGCRGTSTQCTCILIIHDRQTSQVIWKAHILLFMCVERVQINTLIITVYCNIINVSEIYLSPLCCALYPVFDSDHDTDPSCYMNFSAIDLKRKK